MKALLITHPCIVFTHLLINGQGVGRGAIFIAKIDILFLIAKGFSWPLLLIVITPWRYEFKTFYNLQ